MSRCRRDTPIMNSEIPAAPSPNIGLPAGELGQGQLSQCRGHALEMLDNASLPPGRQVRRMKLSAYDFGRMIRSCGSYSRYSMPCRRA
jgi:hypothetical protein